MTHNLPPSTKDEFKQMVDTIESAPGYERPVAFAFGVATVEDSSDGGRTMLDAQFTRRNYEANYGTAAVMAACLNQEEGLQTGNYFINDILGRALDHFQPYASEPGHGNIDTLKNLYGLFPVISRGVRPENFDSRLINPRVPILSVIRDWDDEPAGVGDTYLRLYALSERHRQPNTVNLNGIFGLLPNLVVSEAAGVFSPDRWNETQEHRVLSGNSTGVRVLDKFPRMLDHVVPSGVRVADPSRVRLGAYLGEGTTVMHEGFVNFNAGTLGTSMVEGRISAGVAVGTDSDIGGGASIMGTLSGGGKEKISIGERCLLEANSGIGISLGNDCRVEAGTYVKSTTPVRLPDGNVTKAATLSGQNNMMLRRNAQTGEVELVPNKGSEWGGLNTDLHSNQ